tara:strand:- start:545 stop:1510 length:966 start_codon:yes stop_codon:yes gene_type:complete
LSHTHNIQEISKVDDSFSLKELNLMLKNKKRSIPTKFLYDDLGSKLFEEISNTKEYYLTRTEKKILNKYSSKIINESGARELLELGSGSSKKTKILILKALKVENNITYVSFDISEKALKMSYEELKDISSNLNIKLVKGDFINDLEKLDHTDKPRLYLFLGSTLGNFNNETAIKFLSNISKKMKKNDFLLLGVDKIKNKEIIKAAYNDEAGITEKFNKNILNVINKEYDLNFNPKMFSHVAEFNEDKNQIEMYLKAISNQKINSHIENIEINLGEKILTEISRKFSDSSIDEIFQNSGLEIVQDFRDEKNYYSIYLLKSI